MSPRRTFAGELRARREKAPKLSREKLARESGVSLAGIEYIEVQSPQSDRATVIRLALALERRERWTVDEALEVAGEPPLTDAERRAFAAPSDPKRYVDAMWDGLTAAEKALIAQTIAVLHDKNTPIEGPSLGKPSTQNVRGRRKPSWFPAPEQS